MQLIIKAFSVLKVRIFIGLGVPLLATFLLMFYLAPMFLSQSDTNVQDGGIKVGNDEVVAISKNFSNLIPVDFLIFNLYARNGIEMKKKDQDIFLDTLLNIDVSKSDNASSSSYTHNIKSKQLKKVYEKVNLNNISSLLVTYSVEIDPKHNISNYEDIIVEGDSFKIYALPTLLSFSVIFISLIFIWLGMLVGFNLLLKFILLGYPFQETFDGYVHKKDIKS